MYKQKHPDIRLTRFGPVDSQHIGQHARSSRQGHCPCLRAPYGELVAFGKRYRWECIMRVVAGGCR